MLWIGGPTKSKWKLQHQAFRLLKWATSKFTQRTVCAETQQPTTKLPDATPLGLGKAATIVQLPSGAMPYKRLPAVGTFDSLTMPRGLLARHNTKAGAWGEIVVTQGELQLTVLEGDCAEVVVLRPAGSTNDGGCSADSRGSIRTAVGVVAPQEFHQVKPLTEDMHMFVRFHSCDSGGPAADATAQTTTDGARRRKRGGGGFG